MTYGTLKLTEPITMTPKTDVLRALNQLISLVAGRDMAIATNEKYEEPDDRIRAITNLITEELMAATTSGDIKALKQCQRKVESLTSLKTLAVCLMDEVDWD